MTIRIAFIVVAATTAAADVSAQVPETVPRDLVVAILGNSGGFAREPEVIVGGVAPALAKDVVRPANSRILGSLVTQYQSAAYFMVAGSGDSTSAAYRAQLQGAGWSAPRAMTSGGFQPTSITMTSPGIYCRDSTMVSVTIRELAPRQTRVVVTRMATGAQSVCRQSITPPVQRTSRYVMPVLQNPAGSEVRWYDRDTTCFWRGENTFNTSVTELRSPKPLREILDFYSAQLTRDGWRALDGEAIASRTWTKTDSTGDRQSVTITGRAFGKGCRTFVLEAKR